MERCQSAPAVPNGEDLLVDQSQCWLRGERLPVETYLQLYPGLTADRELILDLICHEILLRSRRGEAANLEEYLQRFPDFAEDLQAQFDVHRALSAEGESATILRAARGAGVPPVRQDACPTELAGYEVLGELGRGAMGVVYLARHQGLKRLVALKMIQPPACDCPRQLARFRGEAEVLARLQHPNIVQIYEVGESTGRPFLALEYLPGGGLDQKLNGSPQPPRAAAQLLWALARGVEAAHRAGVVHRDLKPANVLLAADETPKITDFGLAKQLDAGAGQTNTGDILGTPHYMAPEQACGRRGAVGPWTDVYALGAIFYELLTGRPPFNGTSVWDTLEQLISVDPVPPSRLQAKVPRDLEVICLKCLAKEPARRYARAADLGEDLRRFLSGEAIRARPVPAWERAWRWVRRHRALAALIAASLVSTVVLLGAALLWLKASASHAQLEAREAKEHEAAALSLADLKDGLRQVEAARDAQRWREASTRLAGLTRQLDVARQTFPAHPQFGELRSRAEELRRPIELRLTARERLVRFRALRTEAGFLVMGLAGTDLEARWGRARQVAGEAFALFGAEAESDISVGAASRAAPATPVRLGSPDLPSAEEQREVCEGCCEMLLGLAQLAVESSPKADSSGPSPGVARALTLLDRAAAWGRLAICQSEARPFSSLSDAAAPGVYHSRRSRCLVRLGRHREARAEEEQARLCPPTRAFEFFLRGSDLYADGDLVGAISAFEAALSREPNHAAAAYALALPHLRLRLQADQPAVARAHLLVARMSLTACINQFRPEGQPCKLGQPGLPWPYLCRGFAQGELGEFQAAEEDFTAAEQLLRLRPDRDAHYALLVSRGALRIRRGALTEALQDLTEAVRSSPQDYQAHVNLARAYQLGHQQDEALRQLDRALALAPGPAQAALHRTRARLHQEAGRTAEAVRDLNEAIRLDLECKSLQTAEDLLAKGRLLTQTQDHAGAVEAFDAALKAHPGHPAALRARAEALLWLQREDALGDLNRLLEGEHGRQRTVAPLYRARAALRARAKEYSGAIEDYTQALAAEPDHAGHVGRGWAYLAVDAPALALADFERAVQLEPKDGDAHNGRAYARVKLGQYRDAVADAERALKLGPPLRADTPARGQPAVLARHRYNAARVFAHAAQKAAEDDTLQTTRRRDLAPEYQDRAVVLLRDALRSLPAEERAAFWAGTVQRDSALNSIRQCSAFRQLAQFAAAWER